MANSSTAAAAPVGSTDRDETLLDLFDAQVARSPHAVAVGYEGQSLTYRSLDERADLLAKRLAARGIGPETIVGVCLERSLDLVVALLAVLKAGGAYLPLDPEYPADRHAFMIEDAAVTTIVATTRTASVLPAGPSVILIDSDRPGDGDAALPTPRGVTANDLAYVIYTSGSTGRPKGCCIEHRQVVRLFSSTDQWFGFGPHDVWTLFHSYAFDFSVWEIWGALLYGGRLVVVPQATTRAPASFLRLLSEERVTVLNQTPSAFTQLIRADADEPVLRPLALRTVVFGGEALDPARLRPWYARRGEAAQLVNMYGITETTVHVTYKPLSAAIAASGHGTSPIGVPIQDLYARVLDETLAPVETGTVGELFVGGAGLARGYLRRPELTAERFIQDPLRPGERLYRTGDLARLRSDGELEYFGRCDQQVKIRGFRIELGEVEAALLSHPEIRDAAVVAQDDAVGNAQLVAYLVADTEIASGALRACLGRTLPSHMLPSVFVRLPVLPLTTNGKLDKKALPAPERTRLVTGTAYAAPRSRLEEALAAIWASVLSLDVVGIDENFFDLGGSSLLMADVLARVRASLAPTATIVDLFARPTIRGFAEGIEGAKPMATRQHVGGRAALQAEALRRHSASRRVAP